MGTHTSLDDIRRAPSILHGIHLADELAVAASRDGGTRAVRLLADAARDGSDTVASIAAVHALAQVFDENADAALTDLLEHDAAYVREHAAWAFGSRLPRFDAIAGLASMTAKGGFAGMLAGRTLERWGRSAPDHVALSLEGMLAAATDPAVRERLVEITGLIPARIATRVIRRIALDPAEHDDTRAAAIASIGDREPDDAAIAIATQLASASGPLAAVARLALLDLTVQPSPTARWTSGLTVAQLFLHADIDRELSQVGAGDNGGIATLLLRLGDALVDAGGPHDRVGRVLTMSRGDHEAALEALPAVGSTAAGHILSTVPFLGAAPSMADAWTRRVAAQRGIRRVLRYAGRVDAIHLRMADVGSLAASAVASELGIPTVFTVAPDPHALIRTLDGAGTLTRENFGPTDETEHFWFRVRLVQRLAADSGHSVLFPRPDLRETMRDLVGIDITAHPERHSVVPEGIDLTVIEKSRVDAMTAVVDPTATDGSCSAFASLDTAMGALPEHRRHLPIAITVGRMHTVKGMAALVEAWHGDPQLRERCNLLIVGGDLENPNTSERDQLDRIALIVDPADAAAAGLVLAGHRGNDTVGRWLAATRYGRPGVAAPHGVYVCASVKEEFGIAVLEAMATGLTVVAPIEGGPSGYVDDGVTGYLVDTTDRAALATGIGRALDLAAGAGGFDAAEAASAMVARRFAIQTMADTLAGIYGEVAQSAPFAGLPTTAGSPAAASTSSSWALSDS
ncbi:glycosyltransferase [Marisediminicola senii]|uniref:glycosyltransferase n=1 Tax=Marisediminicola senii TaxID=2711233 RepID=UPI0013E9AEC6|nr:glycosyltransferase [Marisediminicola senii]